MDGTLVKAKVGTILGTKSRGAYVWRSIPYAKPPVGSLRFRHAQPAQPFEGIFEAVRYGAVCPQPGPVPKTMSEDSLSLNIWAPIKKSNQKRAVLFYIHGGSCYKGSSQEAQYDGAKLAKKEDIIVVTINYRLGALGFLDFSFLGDEFEANCGLSDVILALRWVYENIGAFGGDANNITVIGQSAGGNIAAVLMGLSSAKPYIAKTIIMSGCPIWMHQKEEAHHIAKDFMKFMGIQDAAQLHQMSARELVLKQRKFVSQSAVGESSFSIEIDGEMVPHYPIPAAAKGQTKEIPLLIGATSDELSFSCKKPLAKIMMVRDFAIAILAQETKEIRKNILAAYQTYGKKAQEMFVSDQIFRMSSLWFAQAQSRHSKTWMYRFNYKTLIMTLTTLGACHSTDIPFFFGNLASGHNAFMFLFSPIQFMIRRISSEIQKDFTTFAKTGELPWQHCTATKTPAKCYDPSFRVEPMIEPSVVAQYEKSEFKRQSFSGESIRGNLA